MTSTWDTGYLHHEAVFFVENTQLFTWYHESWSHKIKYIGHATQYIYYPHFQTLPKQIPYDRQMDGKRCIGAYHEICIGGYPYFQWVSSPVQIAMLARMHHFLSVSLSLQPNFRQDDNSWLSWNITRNISSRPTLIVDLVMYCESRVTQAGFATCLGSQP